MSSRLTASSGLAAHKNAFFSKFPSGRKLAGALRSERNREPLFFFQESNDPDLRGAWLVLGRLGPELEAMLSIRGEVLILFTVFPDFQRRSYNALIGRARQELVNHQKAMFGNVRFSPDPAVTLLYSPDASARTNVAAWNAEGSRSLVAVLPELAGTESVSREEVANAVVEVLASRDLYRGRNPVTGNDFFGRSELIQQLTAELRAGRSIGLFGLRRSGKTSVLRELRRRSEPTGVVTVLSDLEGIDDLASVVPQLADDLINALRRQKEQARDIWIGPETEQRPAGFPELSSRMVRVAEKNREFDFVIALDEIENLRRIATTSPESVRTFLGALRRASQTTDNLSLVFTGVTTEFFDQSLLPGNLDNPLFGFVEPHYLRPFTRDETGSLVHDLGSLMMLEWEDDALDAVHRLAGGFPFLVRDLASRVREVALTGELPPVRNGAFVVIQVEHVRAAHERWKESATDLWQEIVRTLESYHPIMAELLRCTSDDDLREWVNTGSEAEVAASNLLRLGLLGRADDGGYRREGVLIALQALRGNGTDILERLKSRRLDVERLAALRAQTEGQQLEFKSTSRYNLYTKKRDEVIESAVVKTVAAFLNSQGGTLLIGVDDSGDICGISEDVLLCRKSMDQYERWLCGDLLSRRLGSAVVADHVTFNSVHVEGRDVVEVVVLPSPSVIWDTAADGREALYVRNGNETRELLGRQIAEFLQKRLQR
jgi:hypothetical protein